jgi:hypothetical protein
MSKVCDGREASAKIVWEQKINAENDRRDSALEVAQQHAKQSVEELDELKERLKEQKDQVHHETVIIEGKPCLPAPVVMQLNRMGAKRQSTRGRTSR